MNTHPAVLRPAERLTRSAPSEVEDARRHVDELVGAARHLARLLQDDATDADPVRTLARRLAPLPLGRQLDEHPPTTLAAAERAFRHALLRSLDAVRTCRQTLHVSGACWFTDRHGADGCGEVLRTAHALS